jgi:hypothetical protein
MDSPDDFQPMIDAIFRDKVRWARQESAGRKLVDGITLFEDALIRMRGGIRAQFPHFTDQQVEAELYRRIDRIRQVQEHGIYRTVAKG